MGLGPGLGRKVVKTCTTTQVEKINKDSKTVLLYPNPAAGIITVSVEGSKTILIKDMMGRTVKTIETSGNQFSVSDLADGPYQISIQNEKVEMIARQRFIKI